MPRYIRDVQITIEPQAMHNIISNYLQSEGYEYTEFYGENVFKKGKGIMTGPTIFKFSYSGNMVRMETWMKYAVLPGVYCGEIDFTGFVGAAVKGPWKKRTQQIESILFHYSQPSAQTPNYNANVQYYNEALYQNNTTVNDTVPNQSAQYAQATQRATVYCTNCGAQIPNDSAFCTFCGQSVQTTQATSNINSFATQNQFQQQIAGCEGTAFPPPGQYVSRKDYINNYAPVSVKKDITSIAILCYVCAALSFIYACFVNPLGIIDALLLAALAVILQVTKSKAASIALLIFTIIEVVLSILGGSVPILWLIAGISSIVTSNKIDKMYKQFNERT